MWWAKSAERVLCWVESVVLRSTANIIFVVDIQHEQLGSCVEYVCDQFEYGIVVEYYRIFKYGNVFEYYRIFEYGRNFEYCHIIESQYFDW